jgi:hypothetical protein
VAVAVVVVKAQALMERQLQAVVQTQLEQPTQVAAVVET